jgi:hypothetical protein
VLSYGTKLVNLIPSEKFYGNLGKSGLLLYKFDELVKSPNCHPELVEG